MLRDAAELTDIEIVGGVTQQNAEDIITLTEGLVQIANLLLDIAVRVGGEAAAKEWVAALTADPEAAA